MPPIDAALAVGRRVIDNYSAKGAEYDSQGQAQSASPLVTYPKAQSGLKGRNNRRRITPFQGWSKI